MTIRRVNMTGKGKGISLDDLIDDLIANRTPAQKQEMDEAIALDPDDPVAVAAFEKKWGKPKGFRCGTR